ncbi:MAG: MBL fold metallo-hydrolase [Halobacteriovoraceae bacterium]|nr:MBL fold metallo-hydrolase [Halobacteriovoraceae bacterium]MCB9093922.1 MBL fold metallo-hydrolase [Halobacteriovoraceae bacterium]
MQIESIFDQDTFTLTYIVYDEATKDAVIIDPVLNYDHASSSFSFESFHKLVQFINSHKLNLQYILETHAHADHLTCAPQIKKQFPKAQLAISKNIVEVQKTFKNVFHFPWLETDGSQFDRLISDDEEFSAGGLIIKALSTPGHTPACLSYLIGDCLFTGDALFMPDMGTGRCDFPGGSSDHLYHSIADKIYKLPDSTRIFVGHDYQPGGRKLKYQSSVGEQKESNIQLTSKTTYQEFKKFRDNRDKTLSAPRLLLPSIQVNINAGNPPPTEENGVSYLKLPLKEK